MNTEVVTTAVVEEVSLHVAVHLIKVATIRGRAVPIPKAGVVSDVVVVEAEEVVVQAHSRLEAAVPPRLLVEEVASAAEAASRTILYLETNRNGPTSQIPKKPVGQAKRNHLQPHRPHLKIPQHTTTLPIHLLARPRLANLNLHSYLRHPRFLLSSLSFQSVLCARRAIVLMVLLFVLYDSMAYLGTGFMVALMDGRGRICRLCPVWFSLTREMLDLFLSSLRFAI